MPFYPKPGDPINIDGIPFNFSPNPYAPRMVFGVAGQKATVYRIETKKTGAVLGLKVFEPIFRSQRTADNAEKLLKYAELPGLQVCERTVLTNENHPNLIEDFPDLNFSVVMPWMQGSDWRFIVSEMKSLSHEQCENLAKRTATVMKNMEEEGIAHCDISGGNVKVDFTSNDPTNTDIYLVDVEDIFAPDFPRPEEPSYSTPGYNHKEFEDGVWNPMADRFSTAVLIGEILGWSDDMIAKNPDDPSYFGKNEMQTDCERYQNLKLSLKKNWKKEVEEAFSQAWFSNKLSDCPTITDWYDIFHREEVTPQLPVNYEEIILRRILEAKDFLDIGEMDKAIELLEETYLLPIKLAHTPYVMTKIKRGIIKETSLLYEEALRDYQEVLTLIKA